MSDGRPTDDRVRHAAAVADHLAGFGRVVEVGIGRRSDVAARLTSRGVSVTATDVHPREVPADVAFVRDDVTDPDTPVYADADALYALDCPPDLQGPIADLAGRLGVPFLFTTLGGDPAVVPTCPETVPGGTLFRSNVDD